MASNHPISSSSESEDSGGEQKTKRRRSRKKKESSDEEDDDMSVDAAEERGVTKTDLQRLGKLNKSRLMELFISEDHVDFTEGTRTSHPKGPDPYHVFMPFYPKKGSVDRWKEIKEALHSIMAGEGFDKNELKKLILKYNASYRYKWDFNGLLLFLSETEGTPEWDVLYETLKKMAELALRIEELVTMPIPFLKRGMNKSIALSKEQIACLLAHAFFCTFPMRNAEPRNQRYSSSDSLNLPSINFSSLFRLNKEDTDNSKLKCIFHYFRRITSNDNYDPRGKVIFKRQSVKRGSVDWKNSRKLFTQLHVDSDGRIETEEGLLQVDFANKYVGGGVLGRGCVQEEILFMIAPELIISRLFTEVLEDNEVLFITGTETYSSHTGYADTFEWAADHVDKTASKYGIKLSQIVAMDAQRFDRDKEQFDMKIVERELNKAYCAFHSDWKGKNDRLPAVSTGNWGCGAFGGDKHLKSLLQLMAAAEAGRDVCYFTYGDADLVVKMWDVHELITSHNLRVGEVYLIINNYVEKVKSDRSFLGSTKLFDYILSTYQPGKK